MKEVQASFPLPDAHSSPFNFAPHYGWMMVGGLVFAGAILGLLVYYRPRLLEVASRADAAHDEAPIRTLSEVSDRVDAPFSIRHIALRVALRPPGACRCDIL